VRIRVEEARIRRVTAAEREQAVRAQAISVRRQQDWLRSTRNQSQTIQGGRRVLGELDVVRYPVDRSSDIELIELSDSSLDE
jgi:hypothetical protein